MADVEFYRLLTNNNAPYYVYKYNISHGTGWYEQLPIGTRISFDVSTKWVRLNPVGTKKRVTFKNGAWVQYELTRKDSTPIEDDPTRYYYTIYTTTSWGASTYSTTTFSSTGEDETYYNVAAFYRQGNDDIAEAPGSIGVYPPGSTLYRLTGHYKEVLDGLFDDPGVLVRDALGEEEKFLSPVTVTEQKKLGYTTLLGNYIQSDDPFTPGGYSNTGGGDSGGYIDDKDDIDLPTLPTVGGISTGFISAYNPIGSQVKSLAEFLWSDAFSVDSFKKLFADPMQAIIGLSILPIQPPVSGTGNIVFGNVDTGISANVVNGQYVEVDCGSVQVDEYWHCYLDYSPFTKIQVYLPYSGIYNLSADDVMGKAVNIKYRIDVLSGAFTANIIVAGTVLYTFSGNMATPIPLTGNDWTNTIAAALNVAGKTLIGAAGGNGASSFLTATANAATNVTTVKENIERSGNLAGASGILGVQKPYLIRTRPRQCAPENGNIYTGYPSYITEKLSTLTGYTEVYKIHLDGIPATDAELTEIENLLKGGVII